MSNVGSSCTKRLMSLDVFRGATMASMILVNNSGHGPSTFSSLRHAEWNGWTFADLVFPFFLWIVGVSMTFSFARRIEENADRRMLFQHVLQRATLLFSLGLLLNGFPDYNWETIRIPGVLQRIAVCYLIGAVIFMYTSWRGQMYWIIGLFAAYSMMAILIPVPDYGAGVLTPTENSVRYIDNLLLSGHLSRSELTDSEGVVSTLPAIANVLFGVLCGQLLRREGLAAREKVIWMFVAAGALMPLAWFLDRLMPINKKLWTPPYALLTSGLAFLGFACCYWFIDVLKKKSWCEPLMMYGANAIAIYVASVLLSKLMFMSGVRWFLYQRVFSTIAPSMVASLLYALMFVSMMYVLTWYLYKRGWYLRI